MLDFGFYNMDCMEGMKEFPDKYFDLAIVDPVYGDVTQGGYMKNGHTHRRKSESQKKYSVALWNQEKTGEEYFRELFRVSKNAIIWGGNYFVEEIARDSQCWLIWDKQHPDGISFADAELAFTSFDSATRIFRFTSFGAHQGKEEDDRFHPTQKPVALYRWILSNYAKQGDKLLDTHVGSASSLIAFEERGFDYVGFEIDADYYQKAQKRLEENRAQISMDFLRKLP